MSKLQLSMAMGSNVRSRLVIDGHIQPDGIDLMSSALHGSEIFWRQLHFQDFDISEMSLSSLLIATAQGNRDWVGVPVFTSRQFFHTGIWVRTDSGISKPEDLKGKRVGVLQRVPAGQRAGSDPDA
jgi:4,5-dihydroxyphthalate decarboxylase